jgi:hypothetical protein
MDKETTIIRNEWGLVAHIATVNQTIRARFTASREFTAMQVMAAINQQLTPADRLTIVQVSSALTKLASGDDRMRRIAAGRFCWSRP